MQTFLTENYCGLNWRFDRTVFFSVVTCNKHCQNFCSSKSIKISVFFPRDATFTDILHQFSLTKKRLLYKKSHLSAFCIDRSACYYFVRISFVCFCKSVFEMDFDWSDSRFHSTRFKVHFIASGKKIFCCSDHHECTKIRTYTYYDFRATFENLPAATKAPEPNHSKHLNNLRKMTKVKLIKTEVKFCGLWTLRRFYFLLYIAIMYRHRAGPGWKYVKIVVLHDFQDMSTNMRLA